MENGLAYKKWESFFIQGETNIAIQLIKPEEMDTDGNQEWIMLSLSATNPVYDSLFWGKKKILKNVFVILS